MEQSQKRKYSDSEVRHFIYQTFVDTTRPPTTRETADHFRTSIAAVENAYERLADAHQIALAPGTHSIWMAHPFSGLPTNYVAEVAKKRYWGNWVWDIFGIAAILGKDAAGHAPCGCGTCHDELHLGIRPGQPVDSDWIVHFVVPAAQFWDNIGYTWATILPFSSKDHLDDWLSRQNLTTGYVMTVEKCWQLAQRWYPGRLERDWQRPGPELIQQIFSSLGLEGQFWRITSASGDHS